MTGPYDTWSALSTLAKELTEDTAWEVKESAYHLDIASDNINARSEGDIEEALRRHAEKVRAHTGYDGTTNGRNWLAQNP